MTPKATRTKIAVKRKSRWYKSIFEAIKANKTTLLVATIATSAGIAATFYVAYYSTKQISNFLFPKEFKVLVHDSGGWHKIRTVAQLSMIEAPEYSEELRLIPDAVIDLKEGELSLHLGIWNQARFPAHGTSVRLYFKQEQFEDDSRAIINKLAKANPGAPITVSFHVVESKGKQCVGIIVPFIPARQRMTLRPVKLKLKSNSGWLLVRVNFDNIALFEFRRDRHE